MSFPDFLLIGGSPVVSSIVWVVVTVVLLYMAREAAHRVIRSLSRVMHNGLRLAAKALIPMEKKLALRNREVLLSEGREAKERVMEREFERITDTVKKELADTPALQRRILEEITVLEDDYKQSTEVPPSPPGWINAVDAVAKIPAKGDPVVVDILEDIHDSLVKAHNNATEEYRQSRKERHQLLKNMMPSWRKVQQVLETVDRNVSSLLERARVIDNYMDEYRRILEGTDQAVRNLSSSSFTNFLISGIVLTIALGGAFINFSLIALPMSEMVGGNTYVLDFRVSHIAALVIILIEITMGLFLMETLRITRLFPVIGAMKDTMRIRMMWVSFAFLFGLACVESGLAYMRELMMQERLATDAILNGEAARSVGEQSFTWITTVAQMGMGFILPFALSFVAIPLENFIQALRTVVGVLGVAFIRVLGFTLRLLGEVIFYTGSTLTHVYDLVIFAPLWVEKTIKGHRAGPQPVLTKNRRKVDPPELVKEAS